MFAKKGLSAAPAAVPVYVEDVFSTYLYTTNGTSQTIVNGIDLAGEGGLVWEKNRSITGSHLLADTERGARNRLITNSTDAQTVGTDIVAQAFNNNGFNSAIVSSGSNYVSWTFRKAKKFFDVVTYTGNGTAGRTVSHNLGSTPGTIIIKNTSVGTNWAVYHRSMGATKYMRLNITNGEAISSNYWNNTEPTSTQFTLGVSTDVNDTGYTYVAYLFAHDAGGFGDDGDQSVISCGSVTTSGGAATVTLGWEPQWILFKQRDGTDNWYVYDEMRGWNMTNRSILKADLSDAETSASNDSTYIQPTSTGFRINGFANSPYAYIAIRRGPMKTPENATKVYTSAYGTGSSNPAWISNFPVDFSIDANIGGGSTDEKNVGTRLLGQTYLVTNTTAAEASWSAQRFDYQNGFRTTNNGSTDFAWMFRRAPEFFDVVCYTGNGSTQSVSHNLGVAPELIIVKWRNGGATEYGWRVYHKDEGITKWGQFTTDAFSTASAPYPWDTPTSTVFNLGNGSTWFSINGSSRNFVAYLFASCPGISKVGSYTGTGTSSVNQINCGFTNGARFVLIKRTDSTGSWHIWDSTRGIISGNDPYALLNDSSGQTTNTDWIDPYTSGFELSTASGNNVNTSGATYIYLAIA